MDIDRPHFRTTSTGSSTAAAAATTSELFICFTSRLSSSSMKLSKSILSPGRAARDGGPTTLSSSLSRRLRTNGSLKGGQASPFFTTSGKKRGCAFENPEPSSPKVTCIGQVRVKTKKKVKQTRSLSKRQSGAGAGGEVSFRKIEQSTGDLDDKSSNQQQQRYSNASAHYPAPECLPHRNQRWVHLPISICEALSSLFPCRSSCFSTAEREKIEKQNSGENGCGAVFRWLVAVNEGEGGKKREIELMVGSGDEEEVEEDDDGGEKEEEERVSMRRHVFEDIEVKDDRIELKGQSLEREEEETGRVSICIPPKNALLLMRCRSDPIKMAALANNQNQQHTQQQILQEGEEEDDEEEEIVVDRGVEQCVSKDESSEPKIAVSVEITNEVQDKLEMEGNGQQDDIEINSEEMAQGKTEVLVLEIEEEHEHKEEEEEEVEIKEEEVEELDEVESNMSSFEDLLEEKNAEQFEEEVLEQDTHLCRLSPSDEADLQRNRSPLLLLQQSAAAMEKTAQQSTIRSQESISLNDEESTAAEEEEEEEEEREKQLEEEEVFMATIAAKPEEIVANKIAVEDTKEEGSLLPECLLLMMCEPKLSMEVSKETWVCSTDFMRWLPERPRKAVAKAAKPGGGCDPWKRRLSIDSKPKPAVEKNHEPPRSSCSLPVSTAAASMATMLEQKLVNAVGYEPFVLTRCKSEPMKTAAAKLMPESYFWKNAVRKLEPHAMGVGAAGVGF